MEIMQSEVARAPSSCCQNNQALHQRRHLDPSNVAHTTPTIEPRSQQKACELTRTAARTVSSLPTGQNRLSRAQLVAMDEDDLFYLAPGFDPASLTVPRLRNILLTHDIDYPSNAKKPQLIQLFHDELTPKAKKLLSASKRVKRSARGIVDVPSSQASTVDEEEVPEPEPAPAPATRRGARRKTATAEPDPDATLIAPDTTRSRRTTARGTRSAEPVSVDAEPEPEPVPAPRRRGRPSTKTPKQESPDPEAWHKVAEDSPFSAENPFQSGSSPPAEARATSHRRRTVDPTPATEKRKSTASRRRTDGVVPTKTEEAERSVFEVPVARALRRKSPTVEPEIVPAGEEFEPEEALELAQQEASGQLVRPARARTTKSSSLVLQALLWPLVISAGFMSTLWVQEKYSVGYCGVGNAPRTELAGNKIPEWADSLRPECEPCPQHAECYQNLITKCEDDFVLKHHPLTLGGFLPVPLPPTCEPDSEKARRVQYVVERAVDVLRERNAKYECGEIMPGDSKAPKSPAISEEELKTTLAAKRTKKMSQEEFDALFAEAVPEIMNRDEVVLVENTGKTE